MSGPKFLQHYVQELDPRTVDRRQLLAEIQSTRWSSGAGLPSVLGQILRGHKHFPFLGMGQSQC
jgi:hypothetical protein